MFVVVKKKQLNCFKEVYTARPRDLYMRFGKRESNMNFDSSDEPVRMNMNTLDSLEYIQEYDRQMALQESNRESGGTEAESNGKNDIDSNDEMSDDES